MDHDLGVPTWHYLCRRFPIDSKLKKSWSLLLRCRRSGLGRVSRSIHPRRGNRRHGYRRGNERSGMAPACALDPMDGRSRSSSKRDIGITTCHPGLDSDTLKWRAPTSRISQGRSQIAGLQGDQMGSKSRTVGWTSRAFVVAAVVALTGVSIPAWAGPGGTDRPYGGRCDTTVTQVSPVDLEIAGAFFHVDKSPQNLVARVENGRRVFCAAQRLLPGVKQRVGGFHTLRAPLGESRFGAPFRR